MQIRNQWLEPSYAFTVTSNYDETTGHEIRAYSLDLELKTETLQKLKATHISFMNTEQHHMKSLAQSRERKWDWKWK